MWVLFFLVGGLGFLVCLVTLINKAIRKKPKKVTAILMSSFLVMGVSSMIYAMSTPAIDPSTVVGNGTIINSSFPNNNISSIENQQQNNDDELKIDIIVSDGAKEFAEKYDIPLEHAEKIEIYLKSMTDYTLDDVSNPIASYEDENVIQYDFTLNGEDSWAMISKEP